MTARRFPPPWSVEDIDAAFVVRDHTGQALAIIDHLRPCLEYKHKAALLDHQPSSGGQGHQKKRRLEDWYYYKF
jgi:hypothetical protein